MATDLERLEEYREEERIERAIKAGRIAECSRCGFLTVPHFDEEDWTHIRPLCRSCLQAEMEDGE